MPALFNQNWEIFCHEMARGNVSQTTAYERAYADPKRKSPNTDTRTRSKGASTSSARLMKTKVILDRIQEIKDEVAAAAMVVSIADKQWRLRQLDEMAADIRKIRTERAADPNMARVPGGKTGWEVGRVRFVKLPKDVNDPSEGYTNKPVYEGDVDIALMQQYCAILKQAGHELGQIGGEDGKGGSGGVEGKDRLNELLDVFKTGPVDYVPPADPAKPEIKDPIATP